MKALFEIFGKKIKEFPNASQAYQMATYEESYSREEMKAKLIEDLQRKISWDIRSEQVYVDTSVYSDYREKQVLPEVAKYFEDEGYHVDLHNDEKYQDVNVLIITWQGLEDFV